MFSLGQFIFATIPFRKLTSFKGRTRVIEGKISHIGTDYLGSPYFLLDRRGRQVKVYPYEATPI